MTKHGASYLAKVPSAWMMSFTDLVGLLLAYFILILSMSDLETKSFRELTTSFLLSVDHSSRQSARLVDANLADPVVGANNRLLAAQIKHFAAENEIQFEQSAHHDWISLAIELSDNNKLTTQNEQYNFDQFITIVNNNAKELHIFVNNVDQSAFNFSVLDRFDRMRVAIVEDPSLVNNKIFMVVR